MEITNYNYQISNKHQKPINKHPNNLNMFGFLTFEHWNLFVFWDLRFGAYL
jgi:hypothetical protein